jgi:hypothetical protein
MKIRQKMCRKKENVRTYAQTGFAKRFWGKLRKALASWLTPK